MNTEQAQQSLKDAITTLLKTPPDYWNIRSEFDGDDFAMVGYSNLGSLIAKRGEVEVAIMACTTIKDQDLYETIWKVAREAEEAHDPSTTHITSTTTAIHRFLKTL